MEISYLSYDQMANAFAVGFHNKNVIIVTSSDVELDKGAAAIWVISVCCADGQHCVSNRSVLCQSVTAILHTETWRKSAKQQEKCKRQEVVHTLTSFFSNRGISLLTSMILTTTLHSVLNTVTQKVLVKTHSPLFTGVLHHTVCVLPGSLTLTLRLNTCWSLRCSKRNAWILPEAASMEKELGVVGGFWDTMVKVSWAFSVPAWSSSWANSCPIRLPGTTSIIRVRIKMFLNWRWLLQ